jgi:hypothetical protein
LIRSVVRLGGGGGQSSRTGLIVLPVLVSVRGRGDVLEPVGGDDLLQRRQPLGVQVQQVGDEVTVDPQHLGSQIGQQGAGEGGRGEAGDLQHAESGERTVAAHVGPRDSKRLLIDR